MIRQHQKYLAGNGDEPFLWSMTLDCYDFMNGQPRHIPAGTYHKQRMAALGMVELDMMRLLWRGWLLFKHKQLDDYAPDDEKFLAWVRDDVPDDGMLNEVIQWLWLVP